MKEKIEGYLKKLYKVITKPEMAILPSNIAFNIILAIIPLLTIIVLIASYFNISINLVTDMVHNIMPKQVSEIIVDAISGKGFDRSIGIFNVFAFIVASNGTYAIINTSDTLYKIRKKNYIKARIDSMLLLFIIIILFVFLLMVPIFGENILKLMRNAEILSSFSDNAVYFFNIIKWPMTIFIIFVNVKLIYTVAPSKNIQGEETTYGAAFTTFGWLIAIIIFKFYINHFARYDIIYGNLAAIIILMVWTYFLSYIFVLGMAINVSRKEEQELLEAAKRLEEEKQELERVKLEKKLNKKTKKLNKKNKSKSKDNKKVE